MEVKSIYKYAKISPLKARDVAREIHGLPVSAALDALNFTPRKAAALIGKTLKSAVANAENNSKPEDNVNVDNLVVKEATVGTGPSQRRYKPRARGSAGPILRRTSHITIVLSDEIPLPEPKQKGSAKKGKKGKAKPAAKKKAKAQKPKEEVAAEAAAAEAAVVEATEAAVAPAASEGAAFDEVLGLVYSSAPAEVDDLKEISGVGEVLEGKLNENGIYTFKQITDWNEGNIAAFDDLLSFKDRINRDGWLDQAAKLYAEKYGDA